MRSTVKFKLVSPLAIIPTYAHSGDSGLDLTAIEKVVIPPGEYRLVRTGLAIALPPDVEAQIRPRSGLALEHGITVLNAPGTVDSGYRGELFVLLINHGKRRFTVKPTAKIAQLVFSRVLRVRARNVAELPSSRRGARGFGSTGQKAKAHRSGL
jgi:dUTP pyrophosphatase